MYLLVYLRAANILFRVVAVLMSLGAKLDYTMNTFSLTAVVFVCSLCICLDKFYLYMRCHISPLFKRLLLMYFIHAFDCNPTFK